MNSLPHSKKLMLQNVCKIFASESEAARTESPDLQIDKMQTSKKRFYS